jgi:hypothetical protein
MSDRYLMINISCCEFPKLQLIDEPSLGYDIFICCLSCMTQQGFDEE